MFKNLLSNHHNIYRAASPYGMAAQFRATSPVKSNRTPLKNQINNLQKSPIRNRPSDIKPLKNYINNFLTKRSTSPIRSKSPMRTNPNYNTQLRNITPRKSNLRKDERHKSPIKRMLQKNNSPYYETNNYQNYWKHPSEICGNQPSYFQLPKENSKLFTNLVKNIKSQGQQQYPTSQYNSSQYERDINSQTKRQFIQFQHYNSKKIHTQIRVQTQLKENKLEYPPQTYCKPVYMPVQNSKNQSKQSIGIPFIQSITPSKFVQQPVYMTLKPSVMQSFGIVLQKQQYHESIRESISYNDRVIESMVNDHLELNMSLTK